MREGLAMFAIVGLSLFFGMLLFLELGRRIGLRRQRPEGAAEHGFRSIEGSIIALMGLLLAFTFSAAVGRFNERRQMVVHEVQHIGTAWLRIGALPPEDAPAVRNAVRRYMDARLAAYDRLPDLDAVFRGLHESERIGHELFDRALTASRRERMEHVVLPPINDMLDVAVERTLAMRMHTPVVIFVMLGLLALAAALMIGMHLTTTGRQHTLHAVAYALAIASTIYVIIDLEYPRLGLIRVNLFDRALIELRESLGPKEAEPE
jgi:hypothetical protein